MILLIFDLHNGALLRAATTAFSLSSSQPSLCGPTDNSPSSQRLPLQVCYGTNLALWKANATCFYLTVTSIKHPPLLPSLRPIPVCFGELPCNRRPLLWSPPPPWPPPWTTGDLHVVFEVKKPILVSSCVCWYCPGVMMSVPTQPKDTRKLRFNLATLVCSFRSFRARLHRHRLIRHHWLTRRRPTLYSYINCSYQILVFPCGHPQSLVKAHRSPWKIYIRCHTKAISREKSFECSMPVTQRAKHKASLTAHTKASAARTGRIKKAEPSMEPNPS